MISNNENFKFKRWTTELTNSYTKCRDGEVKIGEEFCELSDAKFVIIGVEESVGPEANYGRPGAENGFDAFCNKFFNLQSNRFLNGENIAFLGRVQVSDVFHEPEYYLAISELDEFVVKILSKFLNNDQTPILIGGGHNNAFPLIQFTSEKYGDKINIVNLDAHADYRKLEGRHSGNPFSYAFDKGFLEKYRVIGLHQSYNSEENLKRLEQDGHEYIFMEDFIDGKRDWNSCIEQVKEDVINDNILVGLELDLDVIQMMPSSACSPFGCEFTQARKYIRTFAQVENVKYLHLPEGAPCDESEKNHVGKVLALLVSDFVSNQKKH